MDIMIIVIIIISNLWKTELKLALSNLCKVSHSKLKSALKPNSIYIQNPCLNTVILGVVNLSSQTHQDIPEKKEQLEN